MVLRPRIYLWLRSFNYCHSERSEESKVLGRVSKGLEKEAGE